MRISDWSSDVCSSDLIGRVERTLFTLDWIEQPEQRRRATRELNKGEAENALKRAIFFHRIGRIRDHALQAQTHRASALNLVAGAIVLRSEERRCRERVCQ